MTLSIFLTPPFTPFTKNAVSVLGYMKNNLIFALMIHRRRYDLKTLKKSAE